MQFFSVCMMLLFGLLLVGCGKSKEQQKAEYLESLQEHDKARQRREKEDSEYLAKLDAVKAEYLAGKVGSVTPQSPAFKSLKPEQQKFLHEKMASILIQPLFRVNVYSKEVPALDVALVNLIEKDLEASADRATVKDYLSLRRSQAYDRKPLYSDPNQTGDEWLMQEKLAEQKFNDTYTPHVQILEKMELNTPEKVQLWYLVHVKSDKEFQALISALQKLYAKQRLTDAEKKLLQETSLTSRTYNNLSKRGN